MRLFDSHCHLTDRTFEKDFDNVLKRCRENNVEAIMLVGIGVKDSKKAVAMADGHKKFYASVGIHPHDAKGASEQALKNLKNLAENKKVKAWGEIGLDFNRMFSPQNIQEKWFLRQMEIANELNLPLIFHERDTNGRFLEMLRSYKDRINGVVHCFSGSKKELKGYLDLGLYIGITGILTIKTRGEALRSLVKYIPKERILIETDAPYLTPAPQKNKTRRNEPAFVASTFFRLARVLEDSPEKLAEIIWENTTKLFDIRYL